MNDCYAKDSMGLQKVVRGHYIRHTNTSLKEISPRNIERGQVLLLVVLLVSVVLTVAMSLLSRSIVNVRLSAEEDQSQKALAAAEAGIEKAILANSGINGILSNSATFSTSYTQLSGGTFLMNNGKIVPRDEGADIWLSDYSSDSNLIYRNPWSGTLSIYWGSSSDSCNASETVNTMAALEIIVVTGNRNNPTATKYVFDPCGSRRISNNFNTPSAGGVVSGRSFAYSARITLGSSGLFARVVPLYANTYIGVQGNPVLPAQGTVIRSTGSSGDVKRTVSVLQENPFLPVEFMTYSFLWPK